ncbi:nucleoside triphosphate pyrophosphohydrolase [Xanthobacter tagetidis]|uniref:Nucleoside triphosphate pyrophosphohydrolase n=1 Tax=Xanthobacter tagetidis TaxID=60216 RepID=A0A3L7AFY1_9HYPH|nr:nucleoside triphosphate pyrophosphohydrolase [Xanthobacter tagetidis]MBB6309691.1 ATP diphosphatase [Xanthobacter tagetidis]RLP78302.1 nucleoside triphosphate pyrophosphohydrolase [Xanthobacter tagetidis]
MVPSRDIARLIEIMAALRTPGSGCPWDLEQTYATIAPYTVEEAYEVADAIARGDLGDLKEELGDLLLQVVFHARMAEEEGAFAFPDVVEAITAKLVRRHPHVFGDARDLSPEAVKGLWAQIKAEEKREKAARRAAAGLPPEETQGVLDGVPLPLPALTRALKLQEKAGRVGFDWNDARQVLAKIREETDEVSEALDAGGLDAVRDEVGDLLFAVVNLARHAGIDPEAALAGTNDKFTRRFRFLEQALEAQGRTPGAASLDEMEALWQAAKRTERAAPAGAAGAAGDVTAEGARADAN